VSRAAAAAVPDDKAQAAISVVSRLGIRLVIGR